MAISIPRIDGGQRGTQRLHAATQHGGQPFKTQSRVAPPGAREESPKSQSARDLRNSSGECRTGHIRANRHEVGIACFATGTSVTTIEQMLNAEPPIATVDVLVVEDN